MQDNQTEQTRAREAIWSIPGHLGRWYGGIFATQYFIFFCLTIWDEVFYRGNGNVVQAILAVQRGMTANILNMAASAYVILEGVMLAQWLKERDKRREREAVETATKAEEKARGAQAELLKERNEWQAWYERMQVAHREGRPFDEPPPSGNSDASED